MTWYYQSGEGLNLLARAAAVATPVATLGTIDTNYPLANLPNGRPTSYVRYSTVADGEYVTFDLNLLAGGDGEAYPLTGWTATVGTIESSSTQTYGSGGSRSVRVYNATAPTAYKDVRMRAGESFRVYYAAWGATGTATARVTNLATGLDLTTAPAWGSGTLVSTAAAAWSSGYVTYTMPTAESGGGLWQTLRVTLAVSGAAGDGYFEVKIVPGWDTVAMLGHTNSPINPLRFSYAALTGNDPRDVYGGAANVSDWTKTVPAAAEVFAADEYNEASLWNKATATRYERWVRFTLTQGVPLTSAVGELILCQAETLPRTPRLQVSDGYEATGQIRQDSGAGDPWTYNRTPVPRHRITLRYQTADEAAMPGPSVDERAIRRMFSGRTHSGLWPVLVIPYGSHDSRAVIYGQPQSVFGVEHMPPERLMEVEILEYPIPGLQPGLFSV